MTPRIYIDHALHAGQSLALPPGAARHVQVLRLQPGAALTLFNGEGGEWSATVSRMGRSEVEVLLGAHHAVDRELPVRVTLALGMPANDRMDTLVEKATELGVFAIQPLHCERSVLRLAGERGDKKIEHWRGVSIAAAEQCGRTRVPRIEPVRGLPQWLGALDFAGTRVVLSLRDARSIAQIAPTADVLFLSGPEGGLSESEEAAALAAGFQAVTLGPRTLRADTAPLAALVPMGLGRL